MGNRKINIPMCLAFILFVLTLITTHLTSGLFARYTVTASGSDSARVAKFDVTGSLDQTEVTVDCNQTKSGTYVITVNNQSEVAVDYIIYVKLDEAVVGTNLWVEMDDIAGKVEQNMIFNRDPLAPGSKKTHKLELGVTDWGTVTGDPAVRGAESHNWELGFTLEIVVEQVD